jgi:hypothetical protein
MSNKNKVQIFRVKYTEQQKLELIVGSQTLAARLVSLGITRDMLLGEYNGTKRRLHHD